MCCALRQHPAHLAWRPPPGSPVRAGHAPKLWAPVLRSPRESHARALCYEAATSSACLGLALTGTFSVEETERRLSRIEHPTSRNFPKRTRGGKEPGQGLVLWEEWAQLRGRRGIHRSRGALTESRRALRRAERRACTPTDPGEVPRSSMPKRNLEGKSGPKEDF